MARHLSPLWLAPLTAAALLVGSGVGYADTSGAGASTTTTGTSSTAPVTVIVRSDSAASAAAAVQAVGGTVVTQLSIINGVSATVPANAVASLTSSANVSGVTADGALTEQDPTTAAAAAASTPVDPVNVLPQDAAAAAGADPASTGGLTGAGVDVALVDTGIAPVPGLNAAGQVVSAPDFSTDPNGSSLDGFGHGTAMASIIAGRDTGDGTGYAGVAPGARLLNVRVGSSDGSVDVSQVIAAIGWITTHAHSNGLNVRVLELAYGTDATSPVNLDPLAYAVDAAWRAGIVVVVSAGNDGNSSAVNDPASDPNILAVGATDTHDTASTSDDTLASFSSGNGGTRHPDLAAAGSRILSLRDPGSFLDTAFPAARRGSLYFRGSGTSQSSAVVSGAVALLLQARPSLTPDQVKALLVNSADTVPAVGTPVLDLQGALTAPVPTTTQSRVTLTGGGSLESARGSFHVTWNGVPFTGDTLPWGGSLLSASLTSLLSGGLASGASWVGTSLTGATWNGASWNSAVWNGATWHGATWHGSTWNGATWHGSSWSGATWHGSTWNGSTWNGSAWDSVSWG